MESNKAVEDIHQPIRMDANANQNRFQTKEHIQDLINHSGALEARGVHHGAMVKQESPTWTTGFACFFVKGCG